MERSPRPPRSSGAPEPAPPRGLGRREFLVVVGGAAAASRAGPVDGVGAPPSGAGRRRDAAALGAPGGPAGRRPRPRARAWSARRCSRPATGTPSPGASRWTPESIRLSRRRRSARCRASDPDRRGLYGRAGRRAREPGGGGARVGAAADRALPARRGARGAVAEVTWTRRRPAARPRAVRRADRAADEPPQLRRTAAPAPGPRAAERAGGRRPAPALAGRPRRAARARPTRARRRARAGLEPPHPGRAAQAWLRNEPQDAARRGDGVPVDALGLIGPGELVRGPATTTRTRGSCASARAAWPSGRARPCAPRAPRCCSPSPSRDESAWLLGGQAYERLVLKATQLGLAHQPHQRADRARALPRAGCCGASASPARSRSCWCASGATSACPTRRGAPWRWWRASGARRRAGRPQRPRASRCREIAFAALLMIFHLRSSSARRRASVFVARDLRLAHQLVVARQPLRRQLARLDRRAHRAARLVLVGAVAEAARRARPARSPGRSRRCPPPSRSAPARAAPACR